MYIAREDILTDDEAQNLIEIDNNNSTPAIEETASEIRQRALLKYSIYLSLAYNARIYPERQYIVWWLF